MMIFRRNPLLFPAGVRPGFNPKHPALGSKGVCRWSTVAVGTTHQNVLNGNVGTSAGSLTTSTRRLIGPATHYVDGCLSTFNALPTTTPAVGVTFAAIIEIAVLTGGQFGLKVIATDPTGWCFFHDTVSHSLGLCSIGSGDNIVSGLALTTDTPYFCVVSSSTAGTFFIVRNLLTGATASTTATASATINNGTSYVVGDFHVGSSSIDGYIATTAFISGACGAQNTLKWAKDPWSFWYPTRDDLIGVTSGSSFSDSVTEAGSATDTDTAAATFAASGSETNSAGDTPSDTATFAASDTELGAAGDAGSTTATFAASDTEAASGSDTSNGSQSGTQTASIIEAAGAQDTCGLGSFHVQTDGNGALDVSNAILSRISNAGSKPPQWRFQGR